MKRVVHWVATAAVLAGALYASDGPERGVARISLINGDVNVRRGDSSELVAAALNAPLVVGDRVYTGPGSRAEIQFDYANMVRIAPGGEVRLAELEFKRYILQVAEGTVTFRVLRDQDADVEISTPNVSVRPVKRGTYRITVRPDGASEITVRSGEAEIFTPRGSERLRAGRTMYARGTQAEPEFRVDNDIPYDDWDRWNQSRDEDLERSRAYNYVSRDIYGAEDLDAHGRWISDPAYGWVWQPTVAPGWAPYRLGRWSWIDYYGWSWISYDPWGWAPYHYGRWYHRAGFGWCWWPGSLSVRHYWSPALVTFIGFGRGGVGIGFGNIGWLPLAPYDPFNRWWGRGWYGGYRNRNYIDNSVNIVNNINVTNVYRNSRIDNAITAVNAGDFGRRGVGNNIRIGREELASASVVRGALPVAPGRESLRMSDRAVREVSFTTNRDNDRFFSRRQPAQVERISFDDQRRGMEEVTRRTFGERAATESGVQSRESHDRPSRTAIAGGQEASAEGTRGEGVSRRSGDRNDTGGWRQFGDPTRSADRGATTERGATTATDRNDSGGWRRFGEPAGRRSFDAEGRTEGRAAGRESRTESNSTGTRGENGWRRFGGTDSGRGEGIDRASGALDNGGVRTLDGGTGLGRSSDRGAGWRRDTEPTPASDRSSRGSDVRIDSGRGSERRSLGGFGGLGGGDSIRMSPSITRERGDGGRFGGGGGSGARMERGGGGESRGSGMSGGSGRSSAGGEGRSAGGEGRGGGGSRRGQ